MPLRGFGIENGVESELRKPRLDITRSGCTVTRENVSPVSLRVDKQVFLPHLHKGVADRSVTMRVKLHGMAHDIGHFVVPSIVHALHRVQYTALNRLQTVGDIRHGAFQDNIRGVVEEPVLVHATKVMHRRSIEAVGGFIVGMRFNALFLVFVLFHFVGHVQAFFFHFVRVFYFVVHSVSFSLRSIVHETGTLASFIQYHANVQIKLGLAVFYRRQLVILDTFCRAKAFFSLTFI